MALGTSDDDRLIQTLYSAAFAAEDGGWPMFLSLLAEQTRAAEALLIIDREPEPKLLTMRATPHWFPERVALSDLLRLRQGRVYSSEELPSAFADQAARVLRVVWARSQVAWLVLLRSGEDFRAADTAKLSSLTAHIPTALTLWQENCAQRSLAELSQSSLAHLGAGHLVLDGFGRVLARDDGAATILRDVSGLSLSPAGNLVVSEGVGAARLASAQETGKTAVSVVSLETDPKVDLLLEPLPQRSTARSVWPDAQTLVRLRHHTQDPIPPQWIASLYDIPLSEARLASALADGANLAEAAEALGLTIETARNYSKKIFSKTGLRGQPDLLRDILNSALRMGKAD